MATPPPAVITLLLLLINRQLSYIMYDFILFLNFCSTYGHLLTYVCTGHLIAVYCKTLNVCVPFIS